MGPHPAGSIDCFMSQTVSTYFNGTEVLQYDRRKPLPILQQNYLTRMDRRMDEGINLHGEWIAAPESMQRAQFVAQNMAQALQHGAEQQAAAMLTYLAQRLPKLRAVRIDLQGDQLTAELVVQD